MNQNAITIIEMTKRILYLLTIIALIIGVPCFLGYELDFIKVERGHTENLFEFLFFNWGEGALYVTFLLGAASLIITIIEYLKPKTK